MDEKIEFIDDFLMRCEDWMHGEDGKDVTLCRKYLIEIREQVKNCSIPDVVGQSEQLVSFLRQYQKACEIMHVNKIDAKNFVQQYKTN